MPRVPTYGGPQVREAALPGARQEAVDVSQGARAVGAALTGMAQVVDAKQRRDADTEAWKFQQQVNEEFLGWSAEARKAAQGANAKGYAAQATQWWDKVKEERFGQLSPLAQQAVAKSLGVSRLSALQAAQGYEDQQLEIGNRAALNGTVTSLQGQAIAAGPAGAAAVLVEIEKTLREYGAKKGVDPEPEVLKATTGVHANIISNLLRSDPGEARKYFVANKKGIDPARWDEIGAALDKSSALVDGNAAAEETWAGLGPKTLNAPVDLAGMQAALRKRFANDPERLRAAQASLGEMVQAHDKSQSEANAYGVNMVYKALDAGVPLSKVRLTRDFLDLPGDMQSRIQEDIEQRVDRRARRVADIEQAELSSYQRRNALALLRNPDEYLRYSDPQVLGGMTRAQVQALRPTLGLQATEHLLQRWEAQQTSAGKLEARMDTEDFNHTADQLGLKPYEANTPARKQALGELKYRVEQLIAAEQKAAKRVLTREEKAELMKREMARTVTVSGFFTDRQVPVVQLNPREVKNVVVPDADKAQIAEALRVMYERTNDAMYAPTEENMRRLYLMNKSPAGALIPNEKK